jgi:hypothetical protein
MEERNHMRLPDTAHTSRPWRIHELIPEFRLEDVWALPTPGGPDDFPRLVRLITSGNASRDSKGAARALWAIRLRLGEILGWDASPRPDASPGPDVGDGPDAGPGLDRPSLRGRLPADLRDLPPGPDFPALPFTPLYLTADEFAAEIINRTVHGVLHLGWVRDDADGADGADGAGRYHGQLAVLVKPNGVLGTGYMAAIRPFRHLIVYPPMIRQIGQAWRTRGAGAGTGVGPAPARTLAAGNRHGSTQSRRFAGPAASGPERVLRGRLG